MSLWSKLTRRKVINFEETSPLSRVLTVLDLTFLGVGSTLGIGIYVLAGSVAKHDAGPAVVLSFFIAALASVLAGLCYAEFSSRVPKSGSAYVYSYVCVGELIAFIVGWNLIMEYMIGVASVARGYSGYIDSLFEGAIEKAFKSFFTLHISFLSEYIDFLSFGITILITTILAFGVRESAYFNKIFTSLNLLVVLFVIIGGAFKANPGNWDISVADLNLSQIDPRENKPINPGNGGFMPFGFSGVMKGAATCFYGFVGFDIIATTGEEAKNPQRSMPLAIVFSLGFIFLAYFGVSTIITMLIPYYLQDVKAPLPYAFEYIDWEVGKWIVTFGALFGLSTSLLGACFPMPRIIYSMSSDGLLFKFLSKVHPKYKTPLIATYISGTIGGILAACFNLDALVDMMSIGTLTAYTLVAVCVLLLRYRRDDEDGEEETNSEEDITLNNLITQIFNRKKLTHPNKISSKYTGYVISLYCLFTIFFNATAIFGEDLIYEWNIPMIILLTFFGAILILILSSLYTQPASRKKLNFKVPFVPLIPSLSVICNIYLIMKLSSATWIRFAVWQTIGFCIYTYCLFTGAIDKVFESQQGSNSNDDGKKDKRKYSNISLTAITNTENANTDDVNVISESNGKKSPDNNQNSNRNTSTNHNKDLNGSSSSNNNQNQSKKEDENKDKSFYKEEGNVDDKKNCTKEMEIRKEAENYYKNNLDFMQNKIVTEILVKTPPEMDKKEIVIKEKDEIPKKDKDNEAVETNSDKLAKVVQTNLVSSPPPPSTLTESEETQNKELLNLEITETKELAELIVDAVIVAVENVLQDTEKEIDLYPTTKDSFGTDFQPIDASKIIEPEFENLKLIKNEEFFSDSNSIEEDEDEGIGNEDLDIEDILRVHEICQSALLSLTIPPKKSILKPKKYTKSKNNTNSSIMRKISSKIFPSTESNNNFEARYSFGSSDEFDKDSIQKIHENAQKCLRKASFYEYQYQLKNEDDYNTLIKKGLDTSGRYVLSNRIVRKEIIEVLRKFFADKRFWTECEEGEGEEAQDPEIIEKMIRIHEKAVKKFHEKYNQELENGFEFEEEEEIDLQKLWITIVQIHNSAQNIVQSEQSSDSSETEVDNGFKLPLLLNTEEAMKELGIENKRLKELFSKGSEATQIEDTPYLKELKNSKKRDDFRKPKPSASLECSRRFSKTDEIESIFSNSDYENDLVIETFDPIFRSQRRGQGLDENIPDYDRININNRKSFSSDVSDEEVFHNTNCNESEIRSSHSHSQRRKSSDKAVKFDENPEIIEKRPSMKYLFRLSQNEQKWAPEPEESHSPNSSIEPRSKSPVQVRSKSSSSSSNSNSNSEDTSELSSSSDDDEKEEVECCHSSQNLENEEENEIYHQIKSVKERRPTLIPTDFLLPIQERRKISTVSSCDDGMSDNDNEKLNSISKVEKKSEEEDIDADDESPNVDCENENNDEEEEEEDEKDEENNWNVSLKAAAKKKSIDANEGPILNMNDKRKS